MRVICINDKPRNKPAAPWVIEEGEVYDVIQVYDTRWGDYYELSVQPGICYDKLYFAPWDGDKAIADMLAETEKEVAHA